VVAKALDAGYNIRGWAKIIYFCRLISTLTVLVVNRTVRSAEKGKAIQDRYSGLHDRFDIAIVEDLVTGDLTEALKSALFLAEWYFLHLLIPFACTDISAVIHVASPFAGIVRDPKRDMLDPAIEGTLNVVRSAHKAGIKRMIITSSLVAVFDFAHGGAFVSYLPKYGEYSLH
jgi:nucleoside-diphosphate-sugar epimerase